MTTEEKISVMQAYVEGKKIQVKAWCASEWKDCIFEPKWYWESCDYRVKPEEKYIPYKDYKEMVDDFCERFGVKCSAHEMPLIWLKSKATDYMMLVTGFSGGDEAIKKFTNYFKEYTYLDGSPVGKKVEE